MIMTLIETISVDFIAAYKAKEMEKKDFLGVLRGEVTREDKTPSDEVVMAKIKSMLKKNIESFELTGVSSLNEMELNVLNSYLPSQMTEAEIDAKLKELIDGGANHIGRIMGGFKGLEADMKVVKTKADAILTN